MATIAYILLGSSVAMVPTLGSMSYFVAPPLTRNLHRTLSKTVANLSKEGIQCFKVISGNKVDTELDITDINRAKGAPAFVLTCTKRGGGQSTQSTVIKDNFDFYYYDSSEFSEYIFPISTVKMSIFGNGEITIKLFWKNFGFFENSVTISGNRDIEKIPWIGKEGEEVPFASFLLKEKSNSFCSEAKLESWDLGQRYGGSMAHIECKLPDNGKSPAPLIWREYKFDNLKRK